MLSRRVLLYTEMVCAATVVHNTSASELEWDAAREAFAPGSGGEGVVLQLGGADPDQLRAAAELAVHRHGYAALNLNCGCPSKRVTGDKGGGRFGAALMLEPERVAACCDAMREGAGAGVPISVKCRIGVGAGELSAHRGVGPLHGAGGVVDAAWNRAERRAVLHRRVHAVESE